MDTPRPDRVDCYWWGEIPWVDRGEDLSPEARWAARPEIQWTERQVRQIALAAGESIAFDEAVRMLIAHGLYLVEGSKIGKTSPALGLWDDENMPEPNSMWLSEIECENGSFRKKIRLPLALVEEIASKSSDLESIQEEIKLLVNIAIEERLAPVVDRSRA